jgi:hypothetical protein
VFTVTDSETGDTVEVDLSDGATPNETETP